MTSGHAWWCTSSQSFGEILQVEKPWVDECSTGFRNWYFGTVSTSECLHATKQVVFPEYAHHKCRNRLCQCIKQQHVSAWSNYTACKIHIEVLCTGCNGKPLVSQGWEPEPTRQTNRMSAAWVCVHEFKCPVSLWGAHNSFLFSSSFLFTCQEVTALSCIGFHDINSAVDATIACAPVRQDQLIPIACCEKTSIIKWILTASKGPFHDEREELMTIHSIGCLDNFACSQNGSAYLSHNVWLSCLFGDIHFKQNVKRIAKQRPKAFCPAACWSDLTHSLQSLHNSVLEWMVCKPNSSTSQQLLSSDSF